MNDILTTVLFSVLGSVIASFIFLGAMLLINRKRKADQHANELERLYNKMDSFESALRNCLYCRSGRALAKPDIY